MGKGSPNNRSVFDFKPGTLQVDRPNDGVLGQPLSTPISQPAPLDFTDDGGIDIEINPAPDPRSFVGEPAAATPSPTPFLQEIGAATPDAPAQSSGFGKGGTRGGSSFGRFGSRGFSKGARGYSQGGSLARSLISLIGRQPEFQAQLANSSMPNAQRAFNTMFAVPMQEGGTLDQAFTQGFKSGVLEPIIATPIPNNNDPYGSAGGLTNLFRPPVYQGVNAYNRGIPVGQPTTPAAIQMAQGFANPSIFSYNNPNPQGTMPSGLAGVAQAQQQPGQMPMAGQAPNQIQPYTMGT